MSTFKKLLGSGSPLRLSRRNTEEKKKGHFRWTQLPDKVLTYLLGFMPKRDINALSRTSKTMKSYFDPHLYRTLPFYRVDNLEKNYRICRVLVTEPLLASYVYTIEDFPLRLQRQIIPRVIIGYYTSEIVTEDETPLPILQTQAINNCINLENLSVFMGDETGFEFPGAGCIWINDISKGYISLKRLSFLDAPARLAYVVNWNAFLFIVFQNQKELECIDLPAFACDFANGNLLITDATNVMVLPRPQCLPNLRCVKSASSLTLGTLLRGPHNITELCVKGPSLNELGNDILGYLPIPNHIAVFEWHVSVFFPLSLQLPFLILPELKIFRLRALFDAGWDTFFLNFLPESLGMCRYLEELDLNGCRCFKAKPEEQNHSKINSTIPTFRTMGPRKSYHENQSQALAIYRSNCLTLRRVILPDGEVWEWDKSLKKWGRHEPQMKLTLHVDYHGRAYFL